MNLSPCVSVSLYASLFACLERSSFFSILSLSLTLSISHLHLNATAAVIAVAAARIFLKSKNCISRLARRTTVVRQFVQVFFSVKSFLAFLQSFHSSQRRFFFLLWCPPAAASIHKSEVHFSCEKIMCQR